MTPSPSTFFSSAADSSSPAADERGSSFALWAVPLDNFMVSPEPCGSRFTAAPDLFGALA